MIHNIISVSIERETRERELREFERNIFWSGWFIVSNSVFVYIATTENYSSHNSTNKIETEWPQSARTAQFLDTQSLSRQPMRGSYYC